MKNLTSSRFRCEICKELFERKAKTQIYCCPCSYKAKPKSAYVKKHQEPKVCTVCNLTFTPAAKTQKICSHVCREKKLGQEAKDRWLNKKERVTKPGLSNFLSYGRVAKKYTSWMKRYNACRG